jgi:hypothetical protein
MSMATVQPVAPATVASSTLPALPSTGFLDDTARANLLSTDRVEVYLAALSEVALGTPDTSNIVAVCQGLEAASKRIQGDERQQDMMKDSGALELALNVMMRTPKNEAIIHAVLLSVKCMVAGRPQAQSRLGELKCIQLVVRSMLQLKNSPRVLAAGFSLLLEMTPIKNNREICGKFFAIEICIRYSSRRVRSQQFGHMSMAFIIDQCMQTAARNRPTDPLFVSSSFSLQARLRLLAMTWSSFQMPSRFWQMLATKYRITKLLSLNLEGFGRLCGALYFRVYSCFMDWDWILIHATY